MWVSWIDVDTEERKRMSVICSCEAASLAFEVSPIASDVRIDDVSLNDTPRGWTQQPCSAGLTRAGHALPK